jgi:multisubunit Na+/H+ antiporter MnhC subunit
MSTLVAEGLSPSAAHEALPHFSQNQAAEPQRKWRSAPEIFELMLLGVVAGAFFVAVISSQKPYRAAVSSFGDSLAYQSVASAIRHWNFEGLQIKQFWGYPYAMAAVAKVTAVSDQTALLLVSWVSSFLSIALAYRLWGGWIAGFFAFLNFDWMQRSFLGGSEPLAVALLFGALWNVRQKRYTVAAFLAALSTVVRPLGVLCLVGIGIVLLHRREYRKLALAFAVAITIGALYVLPLARTFGDPLATVHSYREAARPLFGVPFYAIVVGTVSYTAPLTSLVLSFGWITLVLAGSVRMAQDKKFHDYARQNPVEVLFAVLFLAAVFCYNYPVLARSNFARLVIPVLPVVFFALSRWLPKDRRLLWGLAVVTPVISAASALGIVNVIHSLKFP